MNLYTSSGYTLSAGRELTANYTYSVNAANAPVFVLSMHIIQPFASVAIKDTVIIVKPSLQFTNQTSLDSLGNIVLTITFRSASNLGQFYITVLQHFTAYAISYFIDPKKIGNYDTNNQLYKLYTQSVRYIESDNPEIVAKAKEIAGNESNPYLVAERIQNFVRQHMTYDMAAVTPWNPNTEGALYALRSGKGVCRHYAALFTALARADGIPTVDVWGSRATGQGAVVDDGNNKHNWVQFYIPNYGWIPADPTVGTFPGLDGGDVPIMSVSYTYQRAWGSLASFQSVFASEEPVISLGFQGPQIAPEFTFIQPVTALSLILSLMSPRDVSKYQGKTTRVST
ncbi:MAG TPA: transglutaminase-like domain-containing protein [Terriglobales bacterium]|nr:transglutaminase-like domain-containing protein [Terriglobales bacterium]